jgi:hypothetical protein
MPKVVKREIWTPLQGYEESIVKADFSTRAGLYKKLAEPSCLEIADQRLQKLFQRTSAGDVVPFLEISPLEAIDDKVTMRQILIDRGTAVHNKLQKVLNAGSVPVKVSCLLLNQQLDVYVHFYFRLHFYAYRSVAVKLPNEPVVVPSPRCTWTSGSPMEWTECTCR